MSLKLYHWFDNELKETILVEDGCKEWFTARLDEGWIREEIISQHDQFRSEINLAPVLLGEGEGQNETVYALNILTTQDDARGRKQGCKVGDGDEDTRRLEV